MSKKWLAPNTNDLPGDQAEARPFRRRMRGGKRGRVPASAKGVGLAGEQFGLGQ